jgi:hypothetical protein
MAIRPKMLAELPFNLSGGVEFIVAFVAYYS